MVKFTNDFGEWICLGKSSLKFLNEHFHDDFFQDTSTGKNPLNICLEMDDTSILYPFFMESDDCYYIRLHTSKNGNTVGLILSKDVEHPNMMWRTSYVSVMRKALKPFDIKSLYETLDEE